MGYKDKRIISAMTPEAKAKTAKMESEGRNPVTGLKNGCKKPPCPACEIPPRKGGKPAEQEVKA